MAIEEKPGSVLLVEDEAGVRDAVAQALRESGHEVAEAADGRSAMAHLERHAAEVIVLDLGLPDIDGLDLLTRLRQLDDNAAVVVMTGRDDIQTVVDAMKRGAESFLVKPADLDTLDQTVRKALRQHRLQRHASVYHASINSRPEAGRIGEREFAGRSPSTERVRELIGRVAPTESAVVIYGESGTGKGVVARLIHRNSRRPSGPFVDLNCASLPTTLLESELFGHERGAFTDAKTMKPGLLEVAHGGTMFLDEIGELDASAQAKLLKVIEDRCFRRLGGVREVSVDVRFIVATHRDLEALAAGGRFRQDLFYRLNVFQITIPPLHERGEDVLELAYRFIADLNPQLGRQVKRIAEPASRLLLRYSWPGNVRELRNVIERAMILAQGEEITAGNLPRDLHEGGGQGGVLIETLEQVEAAHIGRVVQLCRGNLKLAAERLGISRSTLYVKLERSKLGAEGSPDPDQPAPTSPFRASRRR